MPLLRRRSRVRVAERRGRGRVVLAAAASMGNYVVPLDAASSGITLPLVEILRDLNKRVPETIVLPASRCASASAPVIPCYLSLSPSLCSDCRRVVLARDPFECVWHRRDLNVRGWLTARKTQTDPPTHRPEVPCQQDAQLLRPWLVWRGS